MMTIREQRLKQLYGNLRNVVKEIDFKSDLAEVLYHALNNSLSTTQLNQFLISLNNELKNYKEIINDMEKQKKRNSI